MKKIMIDMDDVICEGGFIYQLNKFLGTAYTLKDMKGFYMDAMVPREKYDEWNNYLAEQNVYADDGNRFVEGAFETIEALSKKYEVYVVSAFVYKDVPSKSGYHLFNKFKWLCENMTFLHPSRFIFCDQKHLIKCDIKIDDRLQNVIENSEVKLLFDAYHNRSVTDEELKKLGVTRVFGWKDIGRLLLGENDLKGSI